MFFILQMKTRNFQKGNNWSIATQLVRNRGRL